LDLPAADLAARATISNETDPDWLCAEALVFFIRRADQSGDAVTRKVLFRCLAGRCEAFFRGKIRGFAHHDREDICQEVLGLVIEAILASDDRGDFAQVRFWSFLERRTLTTIAKARQRITSTLSLDEPLLAGDDEEIAPGEQVDEGLTPEALAILGDALARLEPRLRQVFLMRHALGMAVGKENRADEDPADPSIASHFGVSARSVGKWLAKAEKQLATFRET
jgi:DNA-directed RNA polymerase specialized sigma24 family protein